MFGQYSRSMRSHRVDHEPEPLDMIGERLEGGIPAEALWAVQLNSLCLAIR